VTPFVSVLGITAIGFLISYTAQKKGWPYHSMPWSYFLLLTVSVVAIKAFEKQRNFAQAALALLALSTGYIVPVKEGLYKSPFADATNEALAGTAKGSAVYILSSDAQKSWPMIVENGYTYPSRFMSWWMVPAIVADGISRLRTMQHGDGGWGWWEYDSSDVFMTADCGRLYFSSGGTQVFVQAL